MALVLTKEQREVLKQKYGGCCSYCGVELAKRWHADHFIPIHRETRYVRDANNSPMRNDKGQYLTETFIKYPEHDVIENMMPSCQKCNNDKSTYDIETWRKVIVGRIQTLNESPKYSSYQKAKKFGLIIETNIDVVFWYEKYNEGITNDVV